MELVKGVNLHFLQSKKFKTNKIKVRFSSPLDENTVAARVLAACMMDMKKNRLRWNGCLCIPMRILSRPISLRRNQLPMRNPVPW